MIEQDVEIAAADGAIPAFAVCPEAAGRFPAVVLYMDAPGIRGELRNFARRIAAQGYFCLLPDMYYRLGTLRFFRDGRNEQETKRMFEAAGSLNNALVMSDTRGLLGFLDGHPRVESGPKGCVGYCMSGQYVVSAAGTYPDQFATAASLYGVGIVSRKVDSPHLLAERIKGELYLGFAAIDQYVPDNVIPDLTAALDRHGVAYQLDVYPDTHHGFCFPERDVYHEGAAEQVWTKLFDLYRRRLGGAAS